MPLTLGFGGVWCSKWAHVTLKWPVHNSPTVHWTWPAMPTGWAGFGNVASWESAFRFPQGRTAIDLPPHFNNTSFPHTSPRMNYGKKDEDADTGLVKIDRTQVFQEGEHSRV